jgi:serine/threonine protein kinase
MSRSSDADFEILDKLGSGAFGTVFKVRRHQDKEVYVIKEVRIEELTATEQNEAINEVNILAGLDSRYIVAYFDSFIEGGSLKIVMEYCNRGDLQGLLRRAQDKNITCLKEKVTWNIGLQIILGLYYLHGQRVLHRDLKTANVFLQKHPGNTFFSVKIGDLGVAKLLETTGAFAKTIVGTPYYLSPELCTDEPYRDKSDCWALGVILYECCTLHRPFEARNQCALIMKIVNSDITPPPTETVSPELRHLITWLLQKKSDKRPTIKDLLREKFIQDAIAEHDFELPEELYALSLTDRLSHTIQGTLDTKPGDASTGQWYDVASNNTTVSGNTGALLGAAAAGDGGSGSGSGSGSGGTRTADAKESSPGTDSSFVRRHNEVMRQEKEEQQRRMNSTDYDASSGGGEAERGAYVDADAGAKATDGPLGLTGRGDRSLKQGDSGDDSNEHQEEYTENDTAWAPLSDGRRTAVGARSAPVAAAAGMSTSRRAPSSTIGPGGGGGGNGVQGNRVRGGAQAQRTPSSKAMTRYQVGTPPAESKHDDAATVRYGEDKQQGLYAAEGEGQGEQEDFAEDSLDMDKAGGAATLRGAEDKGSPGPSYEDDDDWHSESMPRSGASGADVVPVYVETAVGGGQPNTGNNLGNYAAHGQAQAQAQYAQAQAHASRSRTGSFENDHYEDEDFEEYQEEEEREFFEGGEHELSPEYIAHYGVPEGYKASPHAKAAGADEKADFKSDAPENKPIRSSASAGAGSAGAGSADAGSAGAEEYDGGKIEELTRRLTTDLGPELFAKLYTLCMRNMSPHDLEDEGQGEGSSGERQVRHSKDSSYLEEILKELHAHKKADRAAEVQQYVFSLKLLCAFERAQEAA